MPMDKYSNALKIINDTNLTSFLLIVALISQSLK